MQERRTEQMETEECEFLEDVYMSPAEKFMKEFDGSSKDLRAKNQYDLETREITLFGLQYTEDEQIGNWISRTNRRYKAREIPKSSHGMFDINRSKIQLNFLKNLEISNINMEVD